MLIVRQLDGLIYLTDPKSKVTFSFGPTIGEDLVAQLEEAIRQAQLHRENVQ